MRALRARTEPECWRGRKVKKNKKHGNVQQQKTMTTCFEKKKNLVQGVHNMHLFLPMWDTDAHTEHLHRPAPQKSRAQRVHIQKHASPHNENCGLKKKK